MGEHTGVQVRVALETARAHPVAGPTDDADCLCDRVEAHGVPVTDATASHGRFGLYFHAADLETARAVVGELSEACNSVKVGRPTRTGDAVSDDLVLVDRGRLTDRQQEVLETATEMGYFRRPRDANATEVAAELDISPSTFAEHLAAAQSKLFDSLLDV